MEPMPDSLTLGWNIFEIVWIKILLSGDNAILIALACRGLPQERRRLGAVLGALGAVALRIAFTLVIVNLLGAPYLRIFGGLLVIFIAIKLPFEEAGGTEIDAKQTLFSAVASIIVADAVMSLDNVFAIAAAAHGSMSLIVFGLALSAPLVMFGAGFLTSLMERFPILVWGGAAILGWAGRELIASDAFWARNGLITQTQEGTIGAAGCAFVLLVVGAMSYYKFSQSKKKQEIGGRCDLQLRSAPLLIARLDADPAAAVRNVGSNFGVVAREVLGWFMRCRASFRYRNRLLSWRESIDRPAQGSSCQFR
jgi:YjbE family integral membrane protein